MKRNIMIVMLILVIVAPSFSNTNPASDAIDIYQWDKTEKVLFGTLVGIMTIDMLQTRYALNHPDQYRETNPVINAIGPRWMPAYFAVRTAIIWYSWSHIPTGKERKGWLYFANIFNLAIVGYNSYILTARFNF